MKKYWTKEEKLKKAEIEIAGISTCGIQHQLNGTVEQQEQSCHIAAAAAGTGHFISVMAEIKDQRSEHHQEHQESHDKETGEMPDRFS